MSGLLLTWLVIGAALIAGELMTGTFYLLIFGLAAWVAAALTFAGYGLDMQLLGGGIVALIGLAVVVRYGKRWRESGPVQPPDLDVGNEVRIEQVLDASRLKVSYRGATWDAVVETASGAPLLSVGEYCVIRSVRGNTLVVVPAVAHRL
jgi:membrane protein implicated in regulation of membrane protease activity